MAGPLGERGHFQSYRRFLAAQVLRAHRVPLSERRRHACRPHQGLFRHGGHLPQAQDAGLQRPVPDRLRRIRTARRELRDKDRHPSAHSHRPEHPQFHRPAQARRLRIRLEPRCRYDRHRLLQVDPVDIPQDVRARTRFPRQGVRQLLPELQMRALQRGLTGRQVRHLPQRCYPEVEGCLVPAHNGIRRQAA